MMMTRQIQSLQVLVLVALHYLILPVQCKSSTTTTTTTTTITTSPIPSNVNTNGSTTATTSSSPTITTTAFEMMLDKISNGQGFLAALDQSGGSTPKALALYGFPEEEYSEGEESMFDAVHGMRTRIVTNPSFTGDKILGAILFEDTVFHRQVCGMPTAKYLWQEKQIVPFLKIDQGLQSKVQNGVQLMKEIPNLKNLLESAKRDHDIFGTKMRSVIKNNNRKGIKALVKQQFDISKEILKAGLVPIIEPEVDIHSPDKQGCEECLKECLLEYLNNPKKWATTDTDRVILKLSLPTIENFYQECIDHPRCLRVVALSGGYTRKEAIESLKQQHGMIASFSRALTEGLNHGMSEEDFGKTLDESVSAIYDASAQ